MVRPPPGLPEVAASNGRGGNWHNANLENLWDLFQVVGNLTTENSMVKNLKIHRAWEILEETLPKSFSFFLKFYGDFLVMLWEYFRVMPGGSLDNLW